VQCLLACGNEAFIEKPKASFAGFGKTKKERAQVTVAIDSGDCWRHDGD